jgi:phosphatidylserine/phosphatidylglycerophosphate/cardiolipin synthase-like enzyme
VPTIDELRQKWFLGTGGSTPLVRYEGCTVSVYTDNNLVTPLIDGDRFMRVWHDSIVAMTGHAGAEIYQTGWRFENVMTLGESTPTSGAWRTLNDADTGGVTVYVMLSRHYPNMGFNRPSIEWLRLHGLWRTVLDNRFPPAGSNHQKVVSLKDPLAPKALIGSIDISKTRWDTHDHLATNPDRNPTFGKPTHDTGVQIEGAAVADIERSFRDRWNDPSRTFGMVPWVPPQPEITTPVSPGSNAGTHSVQVLHTYGRTSTIWGYSWSPAGEFTCWAAYLNALRAASTYIYIEDQYFLPFDWPPCHTRTGMARYTDIIWNLGEAIRRGVKVAVLVPSNAEDAVHIYQQYQRDLGVSYLAGIAATVGTGDGFTIASPSVGTTPVYVHSKLLIVDDEYVLIGSANVGQRSMSFDGEIDVGVVDSAGLFAKEFRKSLWGEHLTRPGASLDNPVTAYNTFRADVLASSGRVRPYPTTPPAGPPPRGHGRVMTTVVDPYGGPPELRTP